MKQETLDLLATLSHIPSPSGHEEQRAQFIHNWLSGAGIDSQIDQALNVIIPYGDGPSFDVVAAHTDVVFPDEDMLPQKWEEGRLYCPGVGDDTANLTLMLLSLRELRRQNVKPAHSMLFVANSGEEGLGNLKGVRAVCETYAGRIRRFTSFDGYIGHVVTRAVGSRRYRLSFHSQGGHSYADFGNPNAIAQAAEMIASLYRTQIAPKGAATYNVGTITGGTSVNSIAQDCSFTYEYRSMYEQWLSKMGRLLDGAIEATRKDGVDVTVEEVGSRPCGKAVIPGRDEMVRLASDCMKAQGIPHVDAVSGSTDCNIPLSLGIPSVCFGLIEGKGAHTREEYVELASLDRGLALCLQYLQKLASGVSAIG
jgi:acetylornithine deacetylase/succinyl-diaminopimelate desuccinylase-like protein